MSNDNSNTDSNLNRRRFIKVSGLGATAATLGIAGCSGQGGQGGQEQTETPTETEAQQTTEKQSTPSPSQGGRLIWGHSEVTQNLDIHATGTAATTRFLESVYNPVVGLTENFKLSTKPDIRRPGLAKDWSVSDDQLRYEFTLRDGVKFHNGDTLTSADVKYSYERVKNPDTGAIMKFALDPVKSIKTPDDKTVVLELKHVYQPLLRQLTFSGTSIIPEGSGDKIGSQPIGTGPFKFNFRQQGNKAELEGFDDFWGEGPYLDFVEERTVTDPDGRLTGVQEGNYNLINDIPLDNMNSVIQNKDDNLKTHSWTPLSWAFMNMNNAEPPFDDRKFRLAMDFALDKQQLVDGALFGNGRTTATPSYPNSPFRNNDLKVRQQDMDKAKSLLDESKYNPGDFSLKFKVTTNYPWHVDAATIMGQTFNQVGLNVEIQKLTWSDWLSEVWINKNFTLAMVNFFGLWEPAFLYTSLWTTNGSFNFRKYSSDEYDNTIQKAARAGGRQEAIKHYQKAQKILHEDVPDVIIWFRNGTMAAKQNTYGIEKMVSPGNNGLGFGQVWLDE